MYHARKNSAIPAGGKKRKAVKPSLQRLGVLLKHHKGRKNASRMRRKATRIATDRCAQGKKGPKKENNQGKS